MLNQNSGKVESCPVGFTIESIQQAGGSCYGVTGFKICDVCQHRGTITPGNLFYQTMKNVADNYSLSIIGETQFIKQRAIRQS